MRYFLIMNPASGGEKSRDKFKKILAVLSKNSIDFDYKLTETLEDAYSLSVEANKNGCDVIIAVGGDGTINRVINGFYDPWGRRISTSKLAVIHTGTSPDFCKSYNIPLETDQALKTVLAGKSTKIAIGKITYASVYDKGLDGQPLSRENENAQTGYFACCANMGLGASVARRANGGIRKYLGDLAGTFVSLVKALLNYQPGSFSVSIDGQKQALENVYNIAVGKTTYIASGIKVKNDLSSGDKRFYNLVIKEIGFTDWPGVIRKIYSGKRFVNNSAMSLQYSRVTEIYGSSRNHEVEFDGDPRGFLPCIIETAPDPLDLICEVYDE